MFASCSKVFVVTDGYDATLSGKEPLAMYGNFHQAKHTAPCSIGTCGCLIATQLADRAHQLL